MTFGTSVRKWPGADPCLGDDEDRASPGPPAAHLLAMRRYCAADDLRCGNGTIRTMQPFGDDWLEWSMAKKTTKDSRDMTAVIGRDPTR